MWVLTSSTADNATYWNKQSLLAMANPSGQDRDFGITGGGGFAGIWHGLASSGDLTNQPQTGGTGAANYIANGVWHEITVTSSYANGTNLYVNTVKIGSALTQNQNPTGNPFYIGALNNNPTGNQSGQFSTANYFAAFDLSALFVYSRELSAGEITTNYNTFRGRYGR